MAYIPPHKRHSNEANPTPTPAPPPFQSTRKVNSKQKPTQGGGGKILYSKESIPRKVNSKQVYDPDKEWIWFVIPSSDPDGGDGQNELSGSIRMKEFVVDSTKLNDWKKHMIVERVGGGGRGEVSEAANRIVKSPWVSIIEKIQQGLLTSFQTVRDNMNKEGPVLYVPCFVIRFGKFLFYGSAFDFLDNYNKSSAVENLLRPLGKRLYTCVPDSFCETVLGQIIPKVGLDFVEEKEQYFVGVFDKSRRVTFSCKCSVTEATGELNLYKIGLGEVRPMVVDISCLENSLDLRLALSSRMYLTSPTDDEKDALNSLVNSAVKDSEVKGGLRWPLGKESVGDRYVVVGVSHTISKIYKNPFMRLKIRNADGFDNLRAGDVVQEVILSVTELTSPLRDPTMELNPLIDIVRDSLKLVWENFMSWEGSFT